MKIITLFIATLLPGFFSSAFAALAVQPGDVVAALTNKEVSVNFNAINQVEIFDHLYPGVPSPGDTFIGTGYGTLVSPIEGIELTYTYQIAGAFVDLQDGQRLIYGHGLPVDGVSNQLVLYMDDLSNNEGANENNAASYTDGTKVATLDVEPLNHEQGFLDLLTGSGADNITFKLSEADKQQYGIVNNDLFFKISSQILLVDFVSDAFPQAFNFGAFDNNCGGLDNPFNSCSRETGSVEVAMAHAPIPGSIILFASGLGLFPLLFKRKQIKNN